MRILCLVQMPVLSKIGFAAMAAVLSLSAMRPEAAAQSPRLWEIEGLVKQYEVDVKNRIATCQLSIKENTAKVQTSKLQATNAMNAHFGHTTPIYLEYLHQLESYMQEVRAFEQNCKQYEAYLAHLEAYQQQLEAHKRGFPGLLDPIPDPISPKTPTSISSATKAMIDDITSDAGKALLDTEKAKVIAKKLDDGKEQQLEKKLEKIADETRALRLEKQLSDASPSTSANDEMRLELKQLKEKNENKIREMLRRFEDKESAMLDESRLKMEAMERKMGTLKHNYEQQIQDIENQRNRDLERRRSSLDVWRRLESVAPAAHTSLLVGGSDPTIMPAPADELVPDHSDKDRFHMKREAANPIATAFEALHSSAGAQAGPKEGGEEQAKPPPSPAESRESEAAKPSSSSTLKVTGLGELHKPTGDEVTALEGGGYKPPTRKPLWSDNTDSKVNSGEIYRYV